MKNIEEKIRFLNQVGFGITTNAVDGFNIFKSPYKKYGARLGYSQERGFYVSVDLRERDITEIRNLAAALNNLADTAESLNDCLLEEQRK